MTTIDTLMKRKRMRRFKYLFDKVLDSHYEFAFRGQNFPDEVKEIEKHYFKSKRELLKFVRHELC